MKAVVSISGRPHWLRIFMSVLMFCAATPTTAAVVISEFMASNDSIVNDEDGDSSDWIELHNNGSTAVNLAGWSLTDDAADLTQWTIGSLVLGAGEYAIVFASGKDRNGSELHTNFKLKTGGEYLALIEADGTTVASDFAPIYPQQYADVSYGLNPVDNAPGYFPQPTPGVSNADGVEGLAQTVSADIAHGFYDSGQLVTLATDTVGAQIRYTLDGSPPAGGQGCDAPANGDRVNYEYFEGNWTALPDFDALIPVDQGTTNSLDFGLRQRDTEFAFRFTGCVYASQSGEYKFFTTSADGSRLRVNGQTVVDNDGLHGPIEAEGSVFLAKGLHALEVTAFQRTGSQSLAVSWIPAAGFDSLSDSIKMTADNRYTLYVNGAEIATDVNWVDVREYSVQLNPGDVIAVEALDLGGSAGLIADIAANGRRYETGFEWKVSLDNVAGWTAQDFDDSGWSKATEYGNNGVSPWNDRIVGLPQDSAAQWIWGDDNQTQDQTFFRFRLPGLVKRLLKPAAWQAYSGPIAVNKTTVLRAIAVRPGYLDSDVTTQSYIFANDVLQQSTTGQPTGEWPAGPVNGQVYDYGMDPDIVNTSPQSVVDALKSIPSISIVTDQANLTDPDIGIYSNATSSGRPWERPASIELIDPGATEAGFSINGGIRMRGGFSRSDNNPKHAFRMFFRGSYQGDLEYPFYGDDGVDVFEKIDLRTAQNYSWSFRGDDRNTFLREVWSRDSLRAMGHASTRSRYFHLYLNGVYWGLYLSQERISKEYAQSYLGGDKDDYDVVKHDRDNDYRFDATDGLDLRWRQMHGYVIDQQITDTEYAAIQAQVDLDNLIDLMLLNSYSGDLDGSPSYFLRSGTIRNARGNNWYALRDRSDADAKWRFFDHDSEHTLGARRIAEEVDRLGPFAPFNGEANSYFSNVAYMHPYWLHEALVSHVDYRQRISDRVDLHFKNGGVFTPSSALARWAQRRGQVAGSIIAESARWGDSKRTVPFTVLDWQTEVDWVETNIFLNRHLEVLAQLTARQLTNDLDRPQAGANGNDITLSNPNAIGTIYYTTDGSDPRAPGGAISSSATAATNGQVLNFGVTTTVRIRIWDGNNWSAPVEIVVQGNSAPVITDPEGFYSSVGIDELRSIEATDVNGDSLTYAATGLPPGISIDAGTGDITGTSQAAGIYSVAVSVSDGQLVSNLNLDWTVYPRARIILNEYNAVSGSKWLGGGDGSSSEPADATFGRIIGNGGDWFELVVIEDGLDLRGWTIELTDDGVADAILVFSSDPALANLPAGAVITILEDPVTTESGNVVGEDAVVDPTQDDWAMTLVAGSNGSGQFISAESFKVSNDNWQLVLKDSNDQVSYGPVGEGIGGFSGVGSEEVGKLETDPSPLVHPGSKYNDGNSSTFGRPNRYAGGTLEQDFSGLRDGANIAPVISAIADVTIAEGDPLSIQVQATDANNDSLVFSATGLPPAVFIDPVSGLIDTVAAVGSAGVYAVTVSVDDGRSSASTAFVLTINNATGVSVISVSDVTVNEGAGSVDISISLMPASNNPVEVGIHTRSGSARGGQDFYGFSANPISFAPGDTQASVTLTILDDGDIESSETLSLRLFGAVGASIGDATAIVTIVDNDAPVIAQLSVADVTVSEATSSAQAVVSLSQPMPAAVSVGVHTQQQSAQGGQDFYGFSRQLFFAAGETSKLVDLAIINDQLAESTETFRLRLYNAVGADIGDQTAIVTINDDDSPSTQTLSIAPVTVDESSGLASVIVSLDAPAQQPVSVRVHTRAGSALGGQDFYGFTRTLNFAVGEQSRSVVITLVNDAMAESTETMLLRLFSATGATIATEIATVTILDDD